MTIRKLLPFLFFVSGFTACKNYYIPKDSFISQFSGIDSSKLRTVTVQGPMGTVSKYKANPITTIKCEDKKGIPAKLTNGPAIEVRITWQNKKRTVLYFDRMMIQDSTVYGIRSRFLGSRIAIPLSAITKIEVQNGGKRFRYLSVEQ